MILPSVSLSVLRGSFSPYIAEMHSRFVSTLRSIVAWASRPCAFFYATLLITTVLLHSPARAQTATTKITPGSPNLIATFASADKDRRPPLPSPRPLHRIRPLPRPFLPPGPFKVTFTGDLNLRIRDTAQTHLRRPRLCQTLHQRQSRPRKFWRRLIKQNQRRRQTPQRQKRFSPRIHFSCIRQCRTPHLLAQQRLPRRADSADAVVSRSDERRAGRAHEVAHWPISLRINALHQMPLQRRSRERGHAGTWH